MLCRAAATFMVISLLGVFPLAGQHPTGSLPPESFFPRDTLVEGDSLLFHRAPSFHDWELPSGRGEHAWGLEGIPSLADLRSGQAHITDALLAARFRKELRLTHRQRVALYRLASRFYQEQAPRIERLHAMNRIGAGGHGNFWSDFQLLLQRRHLYRRAALRLLTFHQRQHLRRMLFSHHHFIPEWWPHMW